jgi:hypothetical protein
MGICKYIILIIQLVGKMQQQKVINTVNQFSCDVIQISTKIDRGFLKSDSFMVPLSFTITLRLIEKVI